MSRPIISTLNLMKHLKSGARNVAVLDASVRFDPTLPDPQEQFKEKHIPGAVFFDLLKCSDDTSPYMFTLPKEEHFADFVGKVGVDNDTDVFVYDTVNGFYTAPRIWWMFRTFGHEKVSVLEGGLPKWIKDEFPVQSGESVYMERKFKSKFQPSLFATYDQVREGITRDDYQLVDTRPPEWINISGVHQGQNWRSGVIHGATSLPYTNYLTEDGTVFKGKEEMLEVFKNNNLDLTRPLTSTCMIGITACHFALAAAVAGKSDVSVFDGSWQEYQDKTQDEASDS